MALNITTNNVDGVIVVYLSGAIFFGKESASLRTLMKDLLNKSRHIVLDFGDVTYIDSGGLGTLVALYVSARKIGGDIRLARVSNRKDGKRDRIFQESRCWCLAIAGYRAVHDLT